MIRHRNLAAQRGLSMIEMMVGIAIGLIVVAAASLMMTNQVVENNRLMQETQLQQDLRATADLMLHDLRRAGYFYSGANSSAGPSATAWNDFYAPTSLVAKNDWKVLYAYSKGAKGNAQSAGPQPLSTESFGYQYDSNSKAIDALLGASFSLDPVTNTFQWPPGGSPTTNWQPLTDPSTVAIDNFQINEVVQPISLGFSGNPPSPCQAGDANCPCQLIRLLKITITGHLVSDTTVKRTLNVSSRIRNDQIVPSCSAAVAPAP